MTNPLNTAANRARRGAPAPGERTPAGGLDNLVPCFTPGTEIATPLGPRRVEDLQVGDRVVTRDNGDQEIRWRGMRALSAAELAQAPGLRPVLIKAGALGGDLPDRDLMVSPWHKLLIRNEETAPLFDEREVLAAARHMVGRAGITIAETTTITYVHVMFDQHEVLLSNGVWSESFRPDDATLKAIGQAHRAEIFASFPELRDPRGRAAYQPARRALDKDETTLLVR